MAINKNHEFEELDGVKCGIVEKKVTSARVAFLKDILEASGFTVVVVASAPAKPAAATEETTVVETVPETFTVGVTDYTFNTINALFGRVLKTKEGKIVTPAYWNGQESILDDTRPYYMNA